MKKVYEIRKFVVAEDAVEAINFEKNFEVVEVFLTKHSCDILLDELHSKKKDEKNTLC